VPQSFSSKPSRPPWPDAPAWQPGETTVDGGPAWQQADSEWAADKPAWPGDETAVGSPWPDDSESPSTESGEKRPGKPNSHAATRGKSSARGKSSMRSALMVSGVLGVVVVFAVGLVALTVLHGSSNGAAAANVTKATTPSTASVKASATHKATAKAKPKPKPKPKATPSAKPSAKKTATAPPSSTLLTVPAGYKLTFDPSFSRSQLDTSTWSTCYDWAPSPSAGCTNNPAAEKEWYIPSQVNQSGGTLNLVAKQESTPGRSSSGAAQNYTCRSGMVSSKPGFNFTYGLIQITAKLPYGPGLWPALWLAATNDQWPPELDIMEHWYSEPQMKVYDHTVGKQYLGGAVPTPANLSTGFHTYSLLWTKDRVTWYLDGVQTYTTTSYVPQQQMYFIANVADDSTAAGACNGTMEIQSVKVYQP
jgi:beta-glucanase (GH16 family)